MSLLGIIPARLGSTRLAQKLLLDVHGKPLLYYTWRQVKKASLLHEVIVATDSENIRRAVIDFGGRVVMTSEICRSGTERVAEAISLFNDFPVDFVINIQGDEPLISPDIIDQIAQEYTNNPQEHMITAACPLMSKDEMSDPSVVKVVLSCSQHALYFSRSPIPFDRCEGGEYLKHIGIYGYTPHFLSQYVLWDVSSLERTESLEQLRVLERDCAIKVIVGNFESVGVDTIEDLEKVREILKKKDFRLE